MENGNGHHNYFSFDDFRLEGELQSLSRGAAEIHIARRPFQVLLFLIENRDRLVTREELLEKFWNGHEGYDDALRKCVGAIRKALDDTGKSPRYIELRRGSGYRFIGNVREQSTVSRSNGHVASNATAVGQARKIGGSTQRLVLISGLALVIIVSAGFGFYAYRRQIPSTTAKSLTESVAAKRSIAILPIKNLTGDPANDFLSDGITEGLINEVSRIETLKVISRSSAFQFRDRAVSAEEIGKQLGVETILEGGLRLSDKELRVEVRLVNAADGSVMWASNSQQKKMADIFAIEDGITCQIVTELKVKLCGELPPASRYTANVDAYQLYLKGLYYRNRLGADDLKKAVDFFSQALKIDPNYALAHEGLASSYTVMELNAIVPPGSLTALAEYHAARALELDDSLAGAYIALGAVKTLTNYDLAERERYYRQALLKNPNHRTAHLWLANNFTVQGKFDEAEREILRAQEIDPLSLGVHLTLAELYWYWNKPDKVIEQANLMLVSNPDSDGAYSLLARAYAQKKDFEKALQALGRIPSDNLTQAIVLTAAGRGSEANAYGEAFKRSDEARNSPFKLAIVYALALDKEAAFDSLERSYQMRQADLVSLKIDPSLEMLRSDPRYLDLLGRIHLQD